MTFLQASSPAPGIEIKCPCSLQGPDYPNPASLSLTSARVALSSLITTLMMPSEGALVQTKVELGRIKEKLDGTPLSK